MVRINLEIREYVDLEALEHNLNLRCTRIFGIVRFQKENGWTEYQKAIVDTGSPYSVIPSDLWNECDVKKLYPTTIRGIIPKNSASVKAIMGRIKCIFIDEERISQIFEINALFSSVPNVPLILGFSNILDQSKFVIDIPSKYCCIEL